MTPDYDEATIQKIIEAEKNKYTRKGKKQKRGRHRLAWILFGLLAAMVIVLGVSEAASASGAALPGFDAVKQTAAELDADDSYLYWKHPIYQYDTLQRLEPDPSGIINIVLDDSLSEKQKSNLALIADFLNEQFSYINDAYTFVATGEPMESTETHIHVRATASLKTAWGMAYVRSYPYFIVRHKARKLNVHYIELCVPDRQNLNDKSEFLSIAMHEMMHCLLFYEGYSNKGNKSYDNGATVMGNGALEYLYSVDGIFIAPNDLKLLYAAFSSGKQDIARFKEHYEAFESRFYETLMSGYLERYNYITEPIVIEGALVLSNEARYYEFTSDGRFYTAIGAFEYSGYYTNVNGYLVFTEAGGLGNRNIYIVTDNKTLGGYIIVNASDFKRYALSEPAESG